MMALPGEGSTGPYTAQAFQGVGEMMRNAIAGAQTNAQNRAAQQQQMEMRRQQLIQAMAARRQQMEIAQQRLGLNRDQLSNSVNMTQYHNRDLDARIGIHGDNMMNSEANRQNSRNLQRGAAVIKNASPADAAQYLQQENPLQGIDPAKFQQNKLGYDYRDQSNKSTATQNARTRGEQTRSLMELRGREAQENPPPPAPGPVAIPPAPLSQRLGSDAIAPKKPTGLDQGVWLQRQNIVQKQRAANAINKFRQNPQYAPSKQDLMDLRAYLVPLHPELSNLDDAQLWQQVGGIAKEAMPPRVEE